MKIIFDTLAELGRWELKSLVFIGMLVVNTLFLFCVPQDNYRKMIEKLRLK